MHKRLTKAVNMTRKKVKLTWIVNNTARKASLKKRRVGLLKKVSELTTLCDVNAFIIIYSPEEREPQMWPSRPVVEQLLARFNNMSELEKSKKMMNQETYLKERIGKIQDQLKRHNRKNKEMDVSQVMEKLHECKMIDDLNINELQGLIWFSEERKKEIRKRIEYYQQVNSLLSESLPPPPPPTQLLAPVETTAGARGEVNPPESGLWDQWFLDMMNNSKNTSGSSSAKAKSDAGLTSHQALAASSGAANQMWLPHVNPRDYNTGSAIGMSHENPGAYNIGSAMETLQGNINININIGRSSLPRGSADGNIGQPQGNAGEASNDAISMGLPSELFGGSIAGSDVGMPYDVTRQWPRNFYP